MTRLAFAVSMAVGLISAQAASAAWLFQMSESAFGDGKISIAATTGDVGGFGLRCQGSQLSIMYLIEGTDLTQEAADKGNPLHIIKLKLRVDKGEILTLDAFAQVPKPGTLVLAASLDAEQAASIRDAKRNVSVAMSMADQNFYEQSVSAAGASPVVGKVLSNCGL